MSKPVATHKVETIQLLGGNVATIEFQLHTAQIGFLCVVRRADGSKIDEGFLYCRLLRSRLGTRLQCSLRGGVMEDCPMCSRPTRLEDFVQDHCAYVCKRCHDQMQAADEAEHAEDEALTALSRDLRIMSRNRA